MIGPLLPPLWGLITWSTTLKWNKSRRKKVRGRTNWYFIVFLANIAADDVGFIWGKIDRAEVLAQLMLNSKQYVHVLYARTLFTGPLGHGGTLALPNMNHHGGINGGSNHTSSSSAATRIPINHHHHHYCNHNGVLIGGSGGANNYSNLLGDNASNFDEEDEMLEEHEDQQVCWKKWKPVSKPFKNLHSTFFLTGYDWWLWGWPRLRGNPSSGGASLPHDYSGPGRSFRGRPRLRRRPRGRKKPECRAEWALEQSTSAVSVHPAQDGAPALRQLFQLKVVRGIGGSAGGRRRRRTKEPDAQQGNTCQQR